MIYNFSSLAEFADKREAIRAFIREICRDKSELLFVALNEAANNAFFHGYKGVEYSPVEVMVYQENDEIVMIVRHQGKGLKHTPYQAYFSGRLFEDHGRGLEIIRKCTDWFEYNGEGNELIMRKKVADMG